MSLGSRVVSSISNAVGSVQRRVWGDSSLLSSTQVTSGRIREMSAATNRNLGYDDIVKLSGSKDMVLIDVREPDEIKESGKLPGSVNIPLGEVPSALGLGSSAFQEKYGTTKPDVDAPLVFSCRSGKRSQMALNKALELGFTQAKHYAGGWMDWESHTKN